MTENNRSRTTKGNEGTLDLEEIRARLGAGQGKQFWRSLAELAETGEFLDRLKEEFPRETSWINTLSRRDFLKILAAPLALAGLSACSPRQFEKIMPYNEAPDVLVPDQPLFFATAMELDGYAQGLLVESRMGRPIKIEGNPQHPASLGATDAFSQASILSLYDPDRAQVVSSRGNIRTWDDFQAVITQAVEAQAGVQGAGLRLLTGTVTSPTLAGQIRALLERFPQARWHQYDPVGADNARAGSLLAFGEPVGVHYRFENADVVLSLDSNFVFREPGSVRYARDFAKRRQVTEDQLEMNRLYVVESTLTPLGGFAEHRLPLPASQIEAFARELGSRLEVQVEPGPEPLPLPAGWMDNLVSDLKDHRGSSLVIAGPQQSPLVHALAHAINQALDNVGRTVIFTEPVEAEPVDQTESLRLLAQDLEAGKVELLLVLEGNPVFTAPADLNFPEQYQKARLSVYHGLYEDETAVLSGWHIPATHYLEAWSDTRAYDGTVSIVQPLIEPLYGGRSQHELLAVLLGQSGATPYEIVRQYWQDPENIGGIIPDSPLSAGPTTAVPTPAPSQPGGTPDATVQAVGTPQATGTPASSQPGATPDSTVQPGTSPQATTSPGQPAAGSAESTSPEFERAWRRWLHDGVVAGTALPEKAVTLNIDFSAQGQPQEPAPQEPQSLEIIFEPDPSIWDGRFANNAWLQELPKPVTKITWDNAALVSPAAAARLGLSNEDLVELRYRGRSVLAPVWILPGQPENSVTVHLGYGRRNGGQVGPGAGFNSYAIRTSDAPWFGSGLEIVPTGRRYDLATTQDHHTMEGRELVKVGNIEEFRENPEIFHEEEAAAPFAPRQTPPPSLYPEFPYEGNAWGMVINLSSCTGCNACVVACQAENNIPVVGKDEVLNSREMHWLRIDSYFEGGLDNPQVLFEPVPCMHCEKAPCEPVCPVEATVHDSEGLNEMIYNRCVGTRYCSNNCPYKVRRFNFYEYADDDIVPLKLMRNPDVTVRSRGVMEKCTYCIQRIQAGRIEAELEGRPIQDGEVVTACSQACPTQAIIFGDLNDPESRVHKLREQPHNYSLLAELGTQPRTTYLAKLRNPNPEIPEDRDEASAGGPTP